MAINDLLQRLTQSPEAFQEIIGEQAIPYAPGITEQQLADEKLTSEAAQEQDAKQQMADAVANDIVSAPNVPVPEREERQEIREDVQDISGAMPQGVVESGKMSERQFAESKKATEGQEIPEDLKTPQEQLMDELDAFKKESAKNIKDAKSADRWLKLAENLDRALSLYDQASALKATGIPGLQAISSGIKAPERTKDAMAERKQGLDELLAKYREMNKGQLTARDKAYLEEQQASRQLRKESSEENRKLRKDLAEKADKERVNKEANMNRNRILTQARGLLKDDPRYKKSIEQSMEFEGVQKLIPEVRQGNQAALAALGTKLARAMGEVGVLTDTDVVRYLGQKSWGRKLKAWYEGGMKGKLPEESLMELEKNLGEFSKVLNKNVDSVYSNAGSRLKTAFPDLGDKEVEGLLGKVELSDMTQDVDPKIEEYAQKHGLTYAKAQQILKARGYGRK